MDKVLISNSQGESGIVNVIRYFTNNGSEYLIYSLNEVDEAGYTRLYVAKLSGVDGVYSADTLNDNEWNEIKNIVKLIVKSNKEGLPVPVQDLNPKKINNIMLKDKKVFKLNAPLVTDLGNNKPAFESDDSSNGSQKTPFDMPSAPSFETPVQSTFDMPSAPSFETPVQPTFDMPSVPSFETPVQPTFDMPSAPSFETPVQPTFDMPSVPSFETPVQPTFDMPSAPSFETPVQPTFDMPSAPSFETPVQPTFDMPSAPSFETPVQPTFDMPSVSMFDLNNQTQNNAINLNNNVGTEDYKMLYDELLIKNKDMQEKLNKLTDELSKYKNIISNVKNIVEE